MEGKMVATSALVLVLLTLGVVQGKPCRSVNIFFECHEDARCARECISNKYTGGHCSNTSRIGLGHCVCTDCEDGGVADGERDPLKSTSTTAIHRQSILASRRPASTRLQFVHPSTQPRGKSHQPQKAVTLAPNLRDASAQGAAAPSAAVPVLRQRLPVSGSTRARRYSNARSPGGDAKSDNGLCAESCI